MLVECGCGSLYSTLSTNSNSKSSLGSLLLQFSQFQCVLVYISRQDLSTLHLNWLLHQMSKTLAAILGGAAGAATLLGFILLFCFWLCIRRRISRTSETGSSDPSARGDVGTTAGTEFTLRGARCFEMEQLSLATKDFSARNLIGQGKFGEVYKGLLQDGMLVAIKKRPAAPTQEFIDEARYLSSIQHRNLVTLLGYCQENKQQILVYEYIPNGSVSIHLYGDARVSRERLEFKHRLSIAIGAAKGLEHLHSLSPRLIHKDFKTGNVLVDENFIAKVADAGVRNFLGRFDVAGPSSSITTDEIFLAPEVREFRRFSEKSDVYSFGVFLLELVSGQEAVDLLSSNTDQNIVERVEDYQDSGNISAIIDQRLGNSFTAEGMEEFLQLMVCCVDPSSERRPGMSYVVTELDRILEKEMSLTTMMGEGTPVVTLGSQLFRSSK